MTSDDIIMQIYITIYTIEQPQTSQESIDSIYEKVCGIYYKEMDEKL